MECQLQTKQTQSHPPRLVVGSEEHPAYEENKQTQLRLPTLCSYPASSVSLAVVAQAIPSAWSA